MLIFFKFRKSVFFVQHHSSLSDETPASSGDDEEEEACPILQMLAGCARNACRHPLVFDDTVLEWMLQEWKEEFD